MEKEKALRSEWMEESPYGCIYCSTEEYPKAHFANAQMFRLLNTVQESENWSAFISQNLFFMVPFEDHTLFREYLRKARNQTEPLAV